ncbi:MAG: hypothetical protein AAF655_25895 [Bacteroidota bacterium]
MKSIFTTKGGFAKILEIPILSQISYLPHNQHTMKMKNLRKGFWGFCVVGSDHDLSLTITPDPKAFGFMPRRAFCINRFSKGEKFFAPPSQCPVPLPRTYCLVYSSFSMMKTKQKSSTK